MHTQNLLATTNVSFHGDTLVAIKQNDTVYVAMKPICESLGLNWDGQRQLLQRDDVLSTCTVMITVQMPGDDQRRDVIFLPLEYLNGWLFTIDTSRLKNPDTQAKLISYKRECYKALYEHFAPKVAALAKARRTRKAEPTPQPVPEAACKYRRIPAWLPVFRPSTEGMSRLDLADGRIACLYDNKLYGYIVDLTTPSPAELAAAMA
ncbi:MAG: phage antirepressor N-terminal domain-containing protein [Nitrospirae bacterium]|nr:phage antirepressor N-terminal domain-containing protein [Nitrospirota bacterium]